MQVKIRYYVGKTGRTQLTESSGWLLIAFVMLFVALGTEFFLHVTLKVLAQGRGEHESLETILDSFF